MAAFIKAGLLGMFLFGIFGFDLTLQLAEQLNPSGRVFIQAEGEKLYLEQSSVVVSPPGQNAHRSTSGSLEPGSGGATLNPQPHETPGQAESGEATSDPHSTPHSSDALGTNPQTGSSSQPDREENPGGAVPLPPVRLQIPALDLDVPILLTDNDNLPREQYAGWLFKSAFPATVGNMVILGHLDGAAAIFGRLNELQSGDEIRVSTKQQTHVYIVEESLTVADTAVEVIAPTDSPMVTLITCAGDWNPYERSYDQRLVVRANYAAVEDLPS